MLPKQVSGPKIKRKGKGRHSDLRVSATRRRKEKIQLKQVNNSAGAAWKEQTDNREKWGTRETAHFDTKR